MIPQYLAERMALEARIEIHPVISRLGLSVVISPYDDAGRIRQSCRRIGHLVGLGDIDSGDRHGVRLARLRYDRGLGFHRAREYRRHGDPGRLRSEELVGRKLDFVVRTVQTDAFDPQRPRIRRQVFLHIDPGYGPQHLDAETIFPVGLQSGRNGDLAVHGQTPSGSRKRASYSGLDLGLRAARRRRISGERIAVIAGQHQFDRLGRTEELGLKLSAVSGRFEPLPLRHVAIHILAVFLLEHEYHHVLDPVLRIAGQASGSRAGCGRLTVRRTSVPSCLATPSSGDIFVQAAKNKTDSHAITGSRKREPRSSGTGSSLSLFPYLLIVFRLSLPNIPLVYFIPWGDFRINGQAPALIQID